MPADEFTDIKVPAGTEHSIDSPAAAISSETPDADAQAGVQDIEATALAWDKTNLIVAYVMLWFIYFLATTLSGVNNSLLPFVTSAFALHSLTRTVTILSSVIGGVTNLTIACSRYPRVDYDGCLQHSRDLCGGNGLLYGRQQRRSILYIRLRCGYVETKESRSDGGPCQFCRFHHQLVGGAHLSRLSERTWLALVLWHVHHTFPRHSASAVRPFTEELSEG